MTFLQIFQSLFCLRHLLQGLKWILKLKRQKKCFYLSDIFCTHLNVFHCQKDYQSCFPVELNMSSVLIILRVPDICSCETVPGLMVLMYIICRKQCMLFYEAMLKLKKYSSKAAPHKWADRSRKLIAGTKATTLSAVSLCMC
jgi:hypothetical protein